MVKTKPEPYLCRKELHTALVTAGHKYHTRAMYRLVADMISIGMDAKGQYVRATDALSFLKANPHWKPFTYKTVSLVKP